MSNAQEIKSSFRKLLDDGLVHSRVELLAYARQEHPEKQYTEGMLTGALKTLTDPGAGYKCVGRALYQKADMINENYVDNLMDAYLEILKGALEAINRDIHINPFKLMNLNDDDKKKLKKVEKCIMCIESFVSEME